MRTFSFFILIASALVLFSCNDTNDKEKDENTEYAYVVGNWQLTDITFLTPPASPDTLDMMEQNRLNVLKQTIKMTFKADNSAMENFNGRFQTGTWSVQNDSVMYVKFNNNPQPNAMIIRSYDENKINFVIGTPQDRSLYTFTRVIQ